VAKILHVLHTACQLCFNNIVTVDIYCIALWEMTAGTFVAKFLRQTHLICITGSLRVA
jgi:hypothetical protein